MVHPFRPCLLTALRSVSPLVRSRYRNWTCVPHAQITPVWLAGSSAGLRVGTMTRRSHAGRYLRRRPATIDVRVAGKVTAVRVRTFELRLIAIALAACWVVAAALVLIGYRPGGPIDIAVGAASLLPAAIAIAAVRWPPVARGDRAFAAMGWLAAGSLLVLVPSIADVTGQLGGRGVQTLLPSVEAAYPWVLGLIGTCLFSGFGLARRRLGESAMRRRRLVRGILFATLLTAGATLVFGSVAMGNELALRDRVASSSRFGPTGLNDDLPLCDGEMGIGPSARLGVEIDGTLDGRSMGSIALGGDRNRADVRWLAYVATSRELGIHGAAIIGTDTWIRDPVTAWRRST